jgi:hypothetical protein
MPAHARPAHADLLSKVQISNARREHLLGRVATAATVLAAFIAVLAASAISVLLGFDLWG